MLTRCCCFVYPERDAAALTRDDADVAETSYTSVGPIVALNVKAEGHSLSPVNAIVMVVRHF